MIRIPCSILEQVRINPVLYAQTLAANEKSLGGGTHGMFAYWQDVAKLVHQGTFDINGALKDLQSKFLRFDDTLKNQRKQHLLAEQFAKYIALYSKMKFDLVSAKRQIKWQITSESMLTGLTPWVVKDKKSFYSYFFSERSLAWKAELKYPLIQAYLSSEILKCDADKVQIGLYCLETNSFEFKSYSKIELRNVQDEAKMIFVTVENEYNRLKV